MLEVKEFKKMLEVKELKKLSLRLEVKDNTSAGEVSGETIVSNFFNFSNFKTLNT